MYLDKKHFDGKLLKPDIKKQEDKQLLAGREGVKGKRLIGALRYLWRSSGNSLDPRLKDLKSLLQRSPARPLRVAQPPPSSETLINLAKCWFVRGMLCKMSISFKVSFKTWSPDFTYLPPHDFCTDSG